MADGLTVRVLGSLEGAENAAQLAGNLHVYSKFTVMATSSAMPFLLILKVAIESGRFVTSSIEASRRSGDPAITTESLRLIPIARVLRLAAEQVVLTEKPVVGQDSFEPHSLPVSVRPDKVTSDVLEDVAAHYRLGLLLGEPPTAFVATRFGLPKSTAGRWVARARKEGLLGAAIGTRAGEDTQ